MRVLVTGATGFVGSHLVPRLQRDGHRITVLSRNRDKRRELSVLPGVRVLNADLHDHAALRRHLQGADTAINLVGRALLMNPTTLILDEPTVGLDSTSQKNFLHLVQDLKNELGLTVIMVSHDVGQLSHYADQIACLNQRLHWHDRSAMLTDQVIQHVYSCEMDAYKERVKEIAN